MQRDFSSLTRGGLDLLVVGGGIYGAWTAYDAALRGLRVALVERTDWAAGTSSASSKLVHGGLRYLEQFHLGLVRVSLGERRRLAELAPHRVSPLRFVIPAYRGGRVGRLRWRLGLTLYDLLAGRDQPVAPHESLSAAPLYERFPFLRKDGLLGGFSYGDCQLDDARCALEVVDGAVGAGVAAVNRAEVTGILRDGERVIGAVVADRETGAALDVTAAMTIDCSGSWSAGLWQDAPAVPRRTRLTKGVHLVMPALPAVEAFLLLSQVDGRVFFLIPWYGRTLLGTTDTPYSGDPDRVGVETADVDYLLDAANAFTTLGWERSDVEASYAGLRVLPNAPGAPTNVTGEWSLAAPAPGFLMSVGGKFTTARADAARAVDQVMQSFGRGLGARPTELRPFPWAPAGDFGTWLQGVTTRGLAVGLDQETARTAAARFGSGIEALHARIADRPELAARLHPGLPFCRAEVVHAVEHEMARTLHDVLRRRIPLTLLTRPQTGLLTDAAALAGDALGWTPERRQAEVTGLLHAADEQWARLTP
jgi:glycerol-3-phosphate dehydrogenase